MTDAEQKKTAAVTVAVITYHSEETILETLDSILKQTYGPENIELVISDDASKDDTVKLIELWLVKYRSHFRCVNFLSNEVNGGIAKNCNIAWKAATSEWIKTIAGDDILLPNCISDNVDYILEHQNKNISVLFSKMQSFCVAASGEHLHLAIMPSREELQFFQLSALAQYHFLQKQGICGAPSVFINREILKNVGYADERFLVEDYPLWLKLTSKDIKLYFMNVTTVKYRIGESISRNKTTLINERYINDLMNIDSILIFPSLNKSDFIIVIRKKLWANLSLVISRVFKNKVNIFSKFFILCAFTIRPGFLKFQLSKIKRKVGG